MSDPTNDLLANDWLIELQYLIAKADGQGIREDVNAMTSQERLGLYQFLKRTQVK